MEEKINGAPPKYNEELQEKADKYIEIHEMLGHAVPTLVGLALYLDLSSSTITKWHAKPISDSFLLTCKKILDFQHQTLLSKGLKSEHNQQITKLMLSNFGYSDSIKTENKNIEMSHEQWLNELKSAEAEIDNE